MYTSCFYNVTKYFLNLYSYDYPILRNTYSWKNNMYYDIKLWKRPQNLTSSEYLNFTKVQSKLLKIAVSCKSTTSRSHSPHCRFEKSSHDMFFAKSTNSQGKKPQHVWPLLFFSSEQKRARKDISSGLTCACTLHSIPPNCFVTTMVCTPVLQLL